MNDSIKFAWIPVKERLPEKSGAYLVTWQATKDSDPICSINLFNVNLGGFGYRSQGITAWMELPQPYESERKQK